MSAKSLRLRLFVAAAVSIIIALFIAGMALVGIFERYVARRISAELDTYVRQLAANVSVSSDGSLQLSRSLADPRFDQPLSGLYWQVGDDSTSVKLRSRSLWDHVIELPDDPLKPGIVHRHDLPGPNGETLFVSERGIIYTVGDGTRLLRIMAAVNRAEIVDPSRGLAGCSVGANCDWLEAARSGPSKRKCRSRRRAEGDHGQGAGRDHASRCRS
jgi:hypothetical protein